ncbi:MAG: SCO family protein [Pseudomonadota bacterium]
MSRIAATVATAVVAVGLGAAGWYAFGSGQGSDRYAACRASSMAGGAAEIGGPFSMIDDTGARVSEADVITGPTLFYFGYTFCPDVCPLDVSRNAEAIDLLAEQGKTVTPVFVSIDPGRDTPQMLSEFTDFMHPRMVGLTGTQDEVDRIVDAYRVYAERARGTGDDDYYLMNHSTLSYLMAPGEGMLEFYRQDVSAEQMAESIGCFVEHS